MKKIAAITFVALSAFAAQSNAQTAPTVVVRSSDVVAAMNKIGRMQDSLRFMRPLLDSLRLSNDALLQKFWDYQFISMQKDSIAAAEKKRGDALESVIASKDAIIETASPKFFQNNFFWFLLGAGTTAGILLLR